MHACPRHAYAHTHAAARTRPAVHARALLPRPPPRARMHAGHACRMPHASPSSQRSRPLGVQCSHAQCSHSQCSHPAELPDDAPHSHHQAPTPTLATPPLLLRPSSHAVFTPPHSASVHGSSRSSRSDAGTTPRRQRRPRVHATDSPSPGVPMPRPLCATLYAPPASLGACMPQDPGVPAMSRPQAMRPTLITAHAATV